MEQQSQGVGIDVSKATLDSDLRPSGQQFQVKNQASGMIELIKQLQAFKIQQVSPNHVYPCHRGSCPLA